MTNKPSNTNTQPGAAAANGTWNPPADVDLTGQTPPPTEPQPAAEPNMDGTGLTWATSGDENNEHFHRLIHQRAAQATAEAQAIARNPNLTAAEKLRETIRTQTACGNWITQLRQTGFQPEPDRQTLPAPNLNSIATPLTEHNLTAAKGGKPKKAADANRRTYDPKPANKKTIQPAAWKPEPAVEPAAEPELDEAYAAVAQHCGIPPEAAGWLTETLKGRLQNENGNVAFVYKTGDKHYRNITDSGLGGKWRWNRGATGGQLYPIPPAEGLASVRQVLLVEGETSAIAAAYLLRKQGGWLVIGSSGSRNFPATDERNRRIQTEGWPVVAWPDDDPAGEAWLQSVRRWMNPVPVAAVAFPADIRDWTQKVITAGRNPERLLTEILTEALAAQHEIQTPPQPKPKPKPKPKRPKREGRYDPPKASRFRDDDIKAADVKGRIFRDTGGLDALITELGGNREGRGTFRCFNTEAHKAADRKPSLSVIGTGPEAHYRCHGCDITGDLITAYAAARHRGNRTEAYAAVCAALRDG